MKWPLLCSLSALQFLSNVLMHSEQTNHYAPTCAADTCSNSIRVVKTTKQAATDPISYTQAVKV